MHKSIVICSHTEILYSSEKKCIWTIPNHKGNAEGKKGNRKDSILCDSICKQFKLIHDKQSLEKGKSWGQRWKDFSGTGDVLFGAGFWVLGCVRFVKIHRAVYLRSVRFSVWMYLMPFYKSNPWFNSEKNVKRVSLLELQHRLWNWTALL